MAEGWVYFIRDAETPSGRIKIGKTRGTPDLRFFAIQSLSPVRLEKVGVIEGAWRESELHARFRHLCWAGEWFEPGDDLLAFIRENAAPWPEMGEVCRASEADAVEYVQTNGFPAELAPYVQPGDYLIAPSIVLQCLEARRDEHLKHLRRIARMKPKA